MTTELIYMKSKGFKRWVEEVNDWTTFCEKNHVSPNDHDIESKFLQWKMERNRNATPLS